MWLQHNGMIRGHIPERDHNFHLLLNDGTCWQIIDVLLRSREGLKQIFPEGDIALPMSERFFERHGAECYFRFLETCEEWVLELSDVKRLISEKRYAADVLEQMEELMGLHEMLWERGRRQEAL